MIFIWEADQRNWNFLNGDSASVIRCVAFAIRLILAFMDLHGLKLQPVQHPQRPYRRHAGWTWTVDAKPPIGFLFRELLAPKATVAVEARVDQHVAKSKPACIEQRDSAGRRYNVREGLLEVNARPLRNEKRDSRETITFLRQSGCYILAMRRRAPLNEWRSTIQIMHYYN